MTNTTETPDPQGQVAANWTSTQAYLFALITLVVGIAVGFFLRGSYAATPTGYASHKTSNQAAATVPDALDRQNVTPEMLKRMADKQAEPLMTQLKNNQQDAELLAKLGNIYYDTKNFREAIDFYSKAVAVRDSSPVRTDLGTAYWYLGDADSAIREFERALKLDSNNANAYFNLGVVRWKGKMDLNGAVDAWQTLLRKQPNHQNRKQVETMIAQAKQHAKIKPGTKTVKPAM